MTDQFWRFCDGKAEGYEVRKKVLKKFCFVEGVREVLKTVAWEQNYYMRAEVEKGK